MEIEIQFLMTDYRMIFMVYNIFTYII